MLRLEIKDLSQMENKPEPKVSGVSNNPSVVLIISVFLKVFVAICLLKQICTLNTANLKSFYVGSSFLQWKKIHRSK